MRNIGGARNTPCGASWEGGRREGKERKEVALRGRRYQEWRGGEGGGEAGGTSSWGSRMEVAPDGGGIGGKGQGGTKREGVAPEGGQRREVALFSSRVSPECRLSRVVTLVANSGPLKSCLCPVNTVSDLDLASREEKKIS